MISRPQQRGDQRVNHRFATEHRSADTIDTFGSQRKKSPNFLDLDSPERLVGVSKRPLAAPMMSSFLIRGGCALRRNGSCRCRRASINCLLLQELVILGEMDVDLSHHGGRSVTHQVRN